jgi:putative endonuclease
VPLLLSRLIFGLVNLAARKGLAAQLPDSQASTKKTTAQRTGIRGETYAYWYLRRRGYIFIARNYSLPGLKGELDLVGYDGNVLAFVEVKTRTPGHPAFGKPEDAVTPDKRFAMARIARRFMQERRIKDVLPRFDILAIESTPGHPPVVRLHKDAFSP